MNKDLKELSFNELAKDFPIDEGFEERTDGDKRIIVPYKEIRVVTYEMPKFDFNNMDSNIIAKPHRVEIRIRIYEEDVEWKK